jgi:hypothetical protein
MSHYSAPGDIRQLGSTKQNKDYNRYMKVLVACEFSNTVRDAFIRRGHDAYSCDLQHCDHPNKNWRRHIRGDVTPLLLQEWDLIIAHPPCTYLCNSGVRWLEEKKGRKELMVQATDFFKKCLTANALKICVENPIMHKYARKLIEVVPTQLIQPYEFGHPESKATYLWLKGLPLLTPTSINNNRNNTIHKLGSGHSNERSKTFLGIALAMAQQWG